MTANRLTIVMYHFVRELPLTRYPKIKGLLTSRFAGQLEYLARQGRFVTVEQCLAALRGEARLPEGATLLTFDDGYSDHFTNVFPLLDERGIQGCFFPPARAIERHEVLDVNKIHFLLASVPAEQLVREIFTELARYRTEFGLHEDAWYVEKLAHPSRFDPAEVCLIKRLLQFELNEELRARIVGELFARHVAADEAAFSRELYLSRDQLRCMIRHGMYVGSHGYDHVWLNKVPPARQAEEVDRSLEFLAALGAPTKDWIMCYPYGGFDESLLGIIRERGAALAVTTAVDIAELLPATALVLPRLDTNDLPTSAEAEPSKWARSTVA
jgi:peptidoglycan/xylan/chitin deacetylase (PgdA/CDA1 family)